MQIESVLQTKNRSEPAKNQFSVALVYSVFYSDHTRSHLKEQIKFDLMKCLFPFFMCLGDLNGNMFCNYKADIVATYLPIIVYCYE